MAIIIRGHEMKKGQCPLCLYDEVEYGNPTGGDYEQFICPVCSPFLIARSTLATTIQDHERKRLSALIKERHLKGLQVVMLYGGYEEFQRSEHVMGVGYKRLLSNFPIDLEEKIKRGFLNLSRFVDSKEDIDKYGKLHKLSFKDANIFFAESKTEFVYIIEILSKEEGLIEALPTTGPTYTIKITRHGWAKIAELSRDVESNQVFVAMWFEKEMDLVKETIRTAIQESHTPPIYKALFINELQHNADITDRIIVEIRRSHFVVAEFTGARGGVYYEAGFARGLGKDVIYVCKEEDMKPEKIHFDISHISFVTYKSLDELKQKLRDRIAATIVK